MYTPWPRALAVAIALAAANPSLMAIAAPEVAQQVLHFDLPAASLARTLNAITSQSGQVISLPSALVADKRAAALRGDMTVVQALQQALAGTGLELRITDSGNFSVQPQAQGGSALELGATTVNAQALSATSEGTQSYAARAVTIGKGTQTLKEIPQSVTVMTRKQMDDQGLVDLRDAANQTTGVVGVQGVGKGMVLSARGFQIDLWQYDGVAIPRNTYALGNWGIQDLIFFDRMEILRGAAGLLQGTGSPGGAVNLVRKRGQAAPTVALTAKAGSWDHYGLQLDAGGPLNAEGTVRGRFVADEDQSQSFIDYEHSKTHSLYGALDFDLTPDTTLGVGMSYTDDDSRPMIRGLPRYANGSPLKVPRSTYTGARWNQADIEQSTVYADLEHRFNDDWKLKVAAVGMKETNASKQQRIQSAGNGLEPDGSGVEYADWITDFDSTKLGLDLFVNGRFEAFSLAQEITLGGNYSKLTSDDMWARQFEDRGTIFDIDHNRPEPSYDEIMSKNGGRSSFSEYDIRQKGMYGSWRVKLAEPLTAVVGARVSEYDYSYKDTVYRATFPGSAAQASAMTETGEVTPYLGLVYDLSREWAVYASYTDVFEPQSVRSTDGAVLKPIIGSNYELGLKGELLDGRVNTSLAVFRYDHKNRAVTDMAGGRECDGWYCSAASGKVRSQGVEAEISGEVFSGLQLFAGYTFNTTKFLEDPDKKGQVFSPWTPKHMLRVWSDYQLPGDLSRVSAGLGFTSQSHTLGDERTYKIPGYTVWNARLAYQATPQIGLAVNANNLFDKRYIISGYSQLDGNNNFGDPRNLMFSVKYTPQF